MSAQQRGTIEHDGVTFYYSYSTCVGYQRAGQTAHFTTERYSVTTARHIRQFMAECGAADWQPQADFARSLAAFPYVPNASYSKFGRAADATFTSTGYAAPSSIIGNRAPKR